MEKGVIRLDNLKKILTTTFSKKFEITGQRTCEECGATVNIIKTVRDGKEQIVSDCINCENLAIQKEHEDYITETKAKENEIVFERYSIIPDDLLSASFENYIPNHPTQEDALKKAVYYAEKFGGLDFTSLLFKGSYGVGKSHLSKSIADTVKAQGKTVIFVDVPGLLKQIKNTFGTDQTAAGLYQAIERADLVIFDDLGAENVKLDGKGDSWASSELFEILTSRTGKHNVITTNCSSNELKAKYGNNGGRIVSRLMKGTKAVLVDGKDRRIEEF